MRNEKYKLSQPPKLPNKPSAFSLSGNNTMRRVPSQQCEPIFLHKDRNTFDEASFQAKYERALELVARNKERQSRSALNILETLCSQILKMPERHTLSHEVLENVVINCWRLKNSLKDSQSKKQESLSFIRGYVQFFADLYRRCQIHKHGLHMLYLIQANQQFDEKCYSEAIKNCDLSIRHCSGVKNQAHLLKVEYLKCNIHNALNNNREELESIKRCLFFINSLISTTNEEGLREYINQLKKNLITRENHLKEHPNQQKSVEKKASFSLFRKRSLSSLKKQDSQKEIAAEKKLQLNSLKNSMHRSLRKSVHTRSANQSKHMTIRQEKPTFLPVDLTKFAKPQQTLKKKPLKLQQRKRLQQLNERQTGDLMDEIQEVPPPAFNFQALFVRRPNERKQSAKKSKKSTAKIEEEPIQQQISLQQIGKKESLRDQITQQQKIQPVTHYISKPLHTGNGNGNDQILEQQNQQIVRECVRNSQQLFFKNFLRKLALQEENKNQDRLTMNINNYQSRMQSSSSSDYSSSNEFKEILQELPEFVANHIQGRNLFEFYEPDIDCDANSSMKESEELVMYCGIITKFKFTIKIQKKEQQNQVGQVYKELYINFSVMLNNTINLSSTLSFRFYNPYEKNLEIIFDEICKNEMNQIYKAGQSIKFKVLNLLANRLILIKKPNGLALVVKEDSLLKKNELAHSYTQYLKNQFVIYEQNKLTDFTREKEKRQNEGSYITKKSKKDATKLSQPQQSSREKKQENDGSHQVLNFYLPKLIRRMTDDLKQEKSSISSIKRMKTEKFYKDTILSYKSLIKSLNESDNNTKVMLDDQKSLSIVMPSDFNLKISNFFQNQEGVKETSIYEFYYCMKFILIQPAKSEPYKQVVEVLPDYRKRATSIARAAKNDDSSQLQALTKLPRYLEDTLTNFYDQMQIKHLFYLKNKLQTHIKMTCYKIKQIFKKTEEYFYKFQMQFGGQKIKMMKFIATSYDIFLLVNKRAEQKGKEKNVKSSRKLKQKQAKEEYQIPNFDEFSLLNLLKQISKRIFVKKDYIYSIIGIENPHSHFNYINKFKLQGKTVQNKQFMIPHLKYIHILLQKSIKIACDNFKEFAVLTIRQIEKSVEFNVIFYLPKHQRTFSVVLNRNIMGYLQPQHIGILFDGLVMGKQERIKLLFNNHQDFASRQLQNKLWNNFSKLFKFQTSYFQDKMHMLLKIGTYVAFMKDSCFSEYFQLKGKIFHLQISLSKKVIPIPSEFQVKQFRNVHPKRKSASSKELIKRNFTHVNDMKCSGRAVKPSIQKKVNDEQIFKKQEFFERISKIYETQTSKYILYLSLTKIYEIQGNQQEEQRQTKKINLSFYLSDLITLLKDSKKQLYTKEERIYNEFNEQAFSFSILLRAMTIIKYKLINQLKKFKEIDEIFQGNSTIKIQKQFKNNLITAFSSQNDHLYSLNSSKLLYKLQNNIYLINKNLMNFKKNNIVTIFYDEKLKKISFFLTNRSDFVNKQRVYSVKDMKFPWIQFYGKEQLFKISRRMYDYYKNILIFT